MMIDKTEKKEIQPLETEVKEFVCSQPYWAKYICSQILSGSEISDKIIEQAFSYLLEELKLKKETKKPEIPIVYNKITSGDFKEDVIFNSIMNVEGVNALSEKQTIELTPNLTIVYGANGSGKSGYVRLLKNVFYSKDKTPILPNIYNSLVRKPISAIFNFSCNGDTISLKYPENEGNGIFSQFAVFDGDIGKKHLSTRNNFSFRPAGLKLFNAFNMSLEKLSARLNREIQMKNIANPFTDNDIFQGDSIIKTFLIKLSKNSNLNELTNLLPFTESEKLEKIEAEKEFDDLKIKLAQKEKTLKELNRIKEQLKRKKINLEKINLLFSQNQLDLINISIIDCKTKTQNAKIEGVEKFQTEKIKNVGSDEWKNFILAAEKFSSIQNCLEYPVIGDNCLFCHQPINEDVTKNLIRSYWDYTKSISENEAKTAKEKNEKIKNTYLELDLKQFPVSDTLTVWLKEKYEKELLLC